MNAGDKVRRKKDSLNENGWPHSDRQLTVKAIDGVCIEFLENIGWYDAFRFELITPPSLDDQINELEAKLAALCKQKMETEYAADVKLAKDWLDSLVPYTIVAGVSYHKAGKTYRFSVTPV